MILSTAHTFPPGTGDVWFSLNNTTYLNNSCVTLEDISEGNDALLCVTNFTACCHHGFFTGGYWSPVGNWFFPNGTRVPAGNSKWDIYRNRGEMVVCMHRRRGGEEGIYRCVIPDSMNVLQTIYIGVYAANTGE